MLFKQKNITSLFFFSILFFFYFFLGAYGLLDNNEGLYAQISWEMLETGQWVVPHLNGVAYIEKPPLLYWLIALSFKIFGKSVWAARAVPATLGVLTCVLVSRFEIRDRSEKYFPAIILASSAGFFVFSRMVFFDVGLTFFLTGTFFCFWRYFTTRKNGYLHGSAFFLGAAVLFKGFVAMVLVGLVVLCFLAVERELKLILKLLNPLSLGIFLLVTVPWHVLASLEEPGFTWFYFVNEHFLRFLDKRIPKDYYTGPFYYYIPRLLAYFLPWTLIMPFVRWSRIQGKSFPRFLLCWFAVLLIFFSLSRAKANYYMVVGLPPVALWFGHMICRAKHRYALLWGGVGAAMLLLLGGVYYAKKKEDEITVKNSLASVNTEKDVFLYKRFEELSSLPFYLGRRVPIIHSESRDLWYGEQTGRHANWFLDEKALDQNDAYVYVLKRDQSDFEARFQELEKDPIFTGPRYVVYLCNNKGIKHEHDEHIR